MILVVDVDNEDDTLGTHEADSSTATEELPVVRALAQDDDVDSHDDRDALCDDDEDYEETDSLADFIVSDDVVEYMPGHKPSPAWLLSCPPNPDTLTVRAPKRPTTNPSVGTLAPRRRRPRRRIVQASPDSDDDDEDAERERRLRRRRRVVESDSE